MPSEGGAPKRFWARHKTQAALRLLQDEDIDLVSQGNPPLFRRS